MEISFIHSPALFKNNFIVIIKNELLKEGSVWLCDVSSKTPEWIKNPDLKPIRFLKPFRFQSDVYEFVGREQ